MGFKNKGIQIEAKKKTKEIAKKIDGYIPKRVIIDEVHEQLPGKLIIGSQQKTEVIITMSLEEYIELKQQNAYFKGKEETVEKRIDLARDSGYYQGRDSLYEDLLKEENPEPAPINILSVEKEIKRYKKRIIEKLENERNRLNDLLKKAQNEMELEIFYRISGKIEALEMAIMEIEEK